MKTQFGTSGDVRDVDLLAAFVAFWRERTSGVVSFVRAGGTAAFSLADGEVVAVSSSEPRFESSAILVRAGKLEAPALERLGVLEGSDGALAALQAGILTKREWRWGEKIRAIEILADLLSWNDGKYYFDTDARPPGGEFSLAIPRLLLELFLRSRDRHFVDHQLGHTNVPLARSEEFDREFTTFGLTADAESVARLIDGRATADEIASAAPADEFAVRKLLAALCTLGLVQPSPAAAPEAEAAAAEPDMAPGPAPSWEALATTPMPLRSPEVSSEDDAAEPESEAEPEQESHGEPERTIAEDEARDELEEPSLPPQQRGFETWRAPAPLPSDEPLDASSREEAPLDAYPIGEAAQTDFASDQEMKDPGMGSDRGWGSEPSPISAGDPAGSVESAEPVEPERPSRPGGVLAGILVVLVLIVGAFLYYRSRPVSTGAAEPPMAAAATATAPTAAAALAPTVVPLTVAPARAASPAPAPQAPASKRAGAPAPRPTAPPAPTAVAAKPETAAKPEAAPAGRASWTARAARDKKRLVAEKATRYAVQLELACETPSLAEAWKHDRPAGTMWLLTAEHGGRECFKVLWGRYPTLEAAKKAKARTPAFFQTSTNHPAVVRVK